MINSNFQFIPFFFVHFSTETPIETWQAIDDCVLSLRPEKIQIKCVNVARARWYIRMFALNHTSIFHLHRRKCAMPSRSSRLVQPSSRSLRYGRSLAMHIFSSFIILLILSANKNNGKSMVLCEAVADAAASLPLPPTQAAVVFSRSTSDRSVNSKLAGDHNSVVTATAAALHASTTTSQVVNLTRQHGGDVFDAMGKRAILIYFHCNINSWMDFIDCCLGRSEKMKHYRNNRKTQQNGQLIFIRIRWRRLGSRMRKKKFQLIFSFLFRLFLCFRCVRHEWCR